MFRTERSADIRLRRLGKWVAALAVASLAISLSGCGQSSTTATQSKTTPSSTASSGEQTSSGAASDFQKSMLQWTQCMRANGVSNFPDPDAQGRFLIDSKKIDVNTAAFKNAQQACADKFPAGVKARSAQDNSEFQSQMLAYAQCMRANGVPSFPDPEVTEGRVTMKLPAGVDRNSDIFRKAQDACRMKLPTGFGG